MFKKRRLEHPTAIMFGQDKHFLHGNSDANLGLNEKSGKFARISSYFCSTEMLSSDFGFRGIMFIVRLQNQKKMDPAMMMAKIMRTANSLTLLDDKSFPGSLVPLFIFFSILSR